MATIIKYETSSLIENSYESGSLPRQFGLKIDIISGPHECGNYYITQVSDLGEFEEASPWEPLHVERGFDKEDSTLTAFFPNSYIQTIPAEASV